MVKGSPLFSVLLSFLLVGQSLLVVSVPCSMSNPLSELADARPAVHAGHNMAADSMDAAPASDCCEAGAYCSMSGCVSIVALIPPLFGGLVKAIATPRVTDFKVFPGRISGPLLRPPILA